MPLATLSLFGSTPSCRPPQAASPRGAPSAKATWKTTITASKETATVAAIFTNAKLSHAPHEYFTSVDNSVLDLSKLQDVQLDRIPPEESLHTSFI